MDPNNRNSANGREKITSRRSNLTTASVRRSGSKVHRPHPTQARRNRVANRLTLHRSPQGWFDQETLQGAEQIPFEGTVKQTICVRPNYVSRALSQLKGTEVGIACVIGFHEGTQELDVKVREARAALDAGATELDVVLNRKHLLSRDYTMVFEELRTLRGVSTPEEGVMMKVILETSQLA